MWPLTGFAFAMLFGKIEGDADLLLRSHPRNCFGFNPIHSAKTSGRKMGFEA